MIIDDKARSRFMDKVQMEPMSGCWIWDSATNDKGYGLFWLNGKYEQAHRVSYWMHHGPFDKKLHACHRCDSPFCVSPHHIFLGTHQDNMNDMMAKGRRGESTQAAKTHCPQGHPYSGDNLIDKSGPRGAHRYCKICVLARIRKCSKKLSEKKAAIRQEKGITNYWHNSHKTHCPRGHEYTAENTFNRKVAGTKYICRECRTCNTLRRRLRVAKERELKCL